VQEWFLRILTFFQNIWLISTIQVSVKGYIGSR
jgi:hypothetical protein